VQTDAGKVHHRGTEGENGELVTGAAAHKDIKDVMRAFEERAKAAKVQRDVSAKRRKGLSTSATAAPGDMRRAAAGVQDGASGAKESARGGDGQSSGAAEPVVSPALRRVKTAGAPMDVSGDSEGGGQKKKKRRGSRRRGPSGKLG